MNVLPTSHNLFNPRKFLETILDKNSSDILQRLKNINNSYFFKSDEILINSLKDS